VPTGTNLREPAWRAKFDVRVGSKWTPASPYKQEVARSSRAPPIRRDIEAPLVGRPERRCESAVVV